MERLKNSITKVYSEFDGNKFIKLVFDEWWKNLELKQMMRHVSYCLHETLPKDYPKALKILEKVAPEFHGFDAMVFPDYVECYGLDHWDSSLQALVLFTKCCSSEFAIRKFLAHDPDNALEYMLKWAMDENPLVRRLATEGCRPRLPWAMALPEFKKDPTPIIPILEILKNDESESVRRSVANNLNDISKDNPDVTLDICEQWYGESEEIDWIVKRACRDLLKSGNKRALILFGFGDPSSIEVNDLEFDKKQISIGENLRFSFELAVKAKEKCKVRIEYFVYYVKSKGQLSPKIFQIKEADFDPGKYKISKKHSFMDFSTRKHYPGEHSISIVINGEEKSKKSIDVIS